MLSIQLILYKQPQHSHSNADVPLISQTTPLRTTVINLKQQQNTHKLLQYIRFSCTGCDRSFFVQNEFRLSGDVLQELPLARQASLVVTAIQNSWLLFHSAESS